MNIEKMLAECRAHWEKTKPDAAFPDYWLGWQASRESLATDLREAYQKGWDASGEGCNAEHPGDLHERDNWQLERDESLGLRKNAHL